jgi:hypothetical protein
LSTVSLRKQRPGTITFSGGWKPCLTTRCSVRTCTGEVCVRSRFLSDSQNVSWLSRAGWSPGMFSASKLKYSDSTSGPSCHWKPRLANRSTSSFCTIVIGCSAPRGRLGPGSVGSMSVAASSCCKAACANCSRRAASACSSSCLTALAALPNAGRCSFGSVVTERTSSSTSPFGPNNRPSSSASAAASAADWIAASQRSRRTVVSIGYTCQEIWPYSAAALDLPAPS